MTGKLPVTAVILAAGEGTRMKSNRAKVLFPLCGRPMIEYVLDAAFELEPQRIVVVIGHKGDEVIEAVTDGWTRSKEENARKILEFSWQRQQKGTAHAVMAARDALAGLDGDVLILYGDTPLITGDILREFYEAHRRNKADLSLITTFRDDPGSYGRVVRDSAGKVVKIVEAKDLGPGQERIREVNSGIYLVRAEVLFNLLEKVRDDNAKHEYYLTDIVEIASAEGLFVSAFVFPDYEVLQGVNDRYALSEAESRLRLSIAKKLALSGVTVRDPASTYIDFGVTVGKDTVIEPFTFLRGATRIGEGCVIGPYTDIRDSSIGDNSIVWFSVVEASTIGNDVRVGPYSHIRPDSDVQDHVLIGNYAEVKNTKIGAYSKVHHHCYLGDSVIGKYVNVGAGAVTVNYDGICKHQTTIEDGAFVGCNANLIAPVRIGKDAYVAAGSTITSEVPDGALGIARERQTNKEGWVAKRKEKSR